MRTDGLALGPHRVHARLRAHRTNLRTTRVRAQTREQLETDVLVHAHRLGVDQENLRAALELGEAELDLAIETAGAKQRGVQRIRTIRRHQHLNTRNFQITMVL